MTDLYIHNTYVYTSIDYRIYYLRTYVHTICIGFIYTYLIYKVLYEYQSVQRNYLLLWLYYSALLLAGARLFLCPLSWTSPV